MMKRKEKHVSLSMATTVLQLTLYNSRTSCKTRVKMRCRHCCEMIFTSLSLTHCEEANAVSSVIGSRSFPAFINLI